MHPVQEIVQRNKAGRGVGVFSCCSANRDVVKAVLVKARKTRTVALVESTSNQVNPEGGYTGMTAADFRDFVYGIADEIGLARSRVILGGDHLGPLPWCHLPEAQAMPKAEALVRSCVAAGYSKIHLDTSMRVGDDDPREDLAVQTCARRGAELCAAAEDEFARYAAAHPGAEPPVYVLGSEVPVPGGDASDDAVMGVTDPENCKLTIEAYEREFAARGLEDALARVVGFVVEMGVEFHERALNEYDSAAAQELAAYMRTKPFCIEGHSSDYQTQESLKAMCQDGVAILKVGPAFTFSMREGLFALEGIECRVYSGQPEKRSHFREVLEHAMLADPRHWQGYYQGSLEEQAISRAYSFLDRCRYYMAVPEVVAARDRLINNLAHGEIPLCMLSQYLPTQYFRVRAGELPNEAEAILLDKIGDRVDRYLYATKNNGEL